MHKCRKCHFRSKRHVLRRQIRHLHRSAAEVSSFSLLGAVRRDEIVYRLRATGISLMTEVIGFRIKWQMASRVVTAGIHWFTAWRMAGRAPAAAATWPPPPTGGAR